jgi:hypothetical protein
MLFTTFDFYQNAISTLTVLCSKGFEVVYLLANTTLVASCSPEYRGVATIVH